jgi:uncharacterized protein
VEVARRPDVTAGGGAPGTLALAEWRRLVTAMYLAEPREGEAGWRAFRSARERLFAEHPQSPLTPEQRALGAGIPYFPYDPAFRVRATLTPAADEDALQIDTGGPDGIMRCRRVGRLAFEHGELTLFWVLGYGGGLFLPFRDATSGAETYGGGRYLTDTLKGTFGRGLTVGSADGGADGGDADAVVLDFNYAYNPSCAYNARWACPLAPPENHLSTEVRAGELAYPDPA